MLAADFKLSADGRIKAVFQVTHVCTKHFITNAILVTEHK